MAHRTNSESRHPLSVSSPRQIHRDVPGFDNSIPLSPQWRLPKTGDKPGLSTGEIAPHSGYAGHPDVAKSWENDELTHAAHKKKDVFRPNKPEIESGRRERWLDEERDTYSSTRKDHWKDGDKELGDTRRLDNLSTRHFGDGRRGTSDRWIDLSNKDSNFEQRRESKWNTRWGPDNKETEGLIDKGADLSREGDAPLDKGLSSSTNNHRKDEKDGDHHQPRRSYFSQSRGWTENHNHHQNHIPNKQNFTSAYGRGRGENSSMPFSFGRGRTAPRGSSLNSSHPYSAATTLDKTDTGRGDPVPFKYSRMKLLDVYKKANLSSHKRELDGFVQVAVLTQEDSFEPLALCTPTSEELAILKGIDQGDILSSGVPQISKDGTVGRNPIDAQPRRSKLGSREDISAAVDDSGDGSAAHSKGLNSNNPEISIENQMQSYGPDFKIEAMQDSRACFNNKFKSDGLRDVGALTQNSELSMGKNSSSGSIHHSMSMGEKMQMTPHDWKDIPTDVRSKTSDAVGWPQLPKDQSLWENNLFNPFHTRDDVRRQPEDPVIKRQSSSVLMRGDETLKASQSSPEDLVLYYKDPRGAIQGPFSGSDIIGWFDAGYFGIDLPVRLASVPHDSPFLSLGDVMPHLKAKARPPPGFGSSGPNEIIDAPIQANFGGIVKLQTSTSETDLIDEPRHKNAATADAENRFLESLMTGNLGSSRLDKFSHSEGLQGHGVKSPSALPSMDLNSENISHLLANKLTLEQQRSVPNHPCWPGMDAASMVPKPEAGLDPTTQHAKMPSSMFDSSHQSFNAQNLDLLSILQGRPGRPSTSANNGVSNWSVFPVQGGAVPLQDQLNLHQGQNFPPQAAYGIQQPRMHQQNQPSLTNLAQSVGNLSGLLTPETLQSSGLLKNQPMLSQLEQLYLMQLNSQASSPTQELPLLDRLLLLLQQQQQQQQQQHQQQQLLWQQQLFSKVLSEQQFPQRIVESSYGQFQANTIPAGNASLDQPHLESSQELFQRSPGLNVHDEHVASFSNLLPHVSQNVSYSANPETTSLNLPHHIFDNVSHQKDMSAMYPGQMVDSQQNNSVLSSEVMDNLSVEPPVLQKSLASDDSFSQSISRTDEHGAVAVSTANFQPSDCLHLMLGRTNEKEIFTPEQTNDIVAQPVDVIDEQPVKVEQCSSERSVVKETKAIDAQQARKTTEKKSKKQKSSKGGSSKALVSEQPKLSATGMSEDTDYQPVASALPESIDDISESADLKEQTLKVEVQNAQAHPGHCAWKPAPGFKAKSLLEIQQEEQSKALTLDSDANTCVNSRSSHSPWSGILANSDSKIPMEFHQDADNAELNSGKFEISKNPISKNSQPHDLVRGEALSKSNERDFEGLVNAHSLPSLPVTKDGLDANDDGDFIEAKDVKKGRKKSARAKGGVAKSLVPAASDDVSVLPSSLDKGRTSRTTPLEEALPPLPSGPSLGDFVLWKGESANSPPTPAWSADSGKPQRPSSLRDILKEQGKKVSSVQAPIPVPAPQKTHQTQADQGSASARSISGSSSFKAASPVQCSLHAAAHSKYKEDDDLFWGPVEQLKQEPKQADGINLASQSSWGTKTPPTKGVPSGSLGGKLKLSASKPAERSPFCSAASSQMSSVKGKRNTMNKHSDALGFRDWCESESIRLTGTSDTSFLEFCVKQSRSEAETLLVQNLGPLDPNHEFIDKFLNYMELLPADVLEIAFLSRDDLAGFSVKEEGVSNDVGSRAAGNVKKKGKKGKKVSPAVLGFNVVSNRIMMGEIQSVED